MNHRLLLSLLLVNTFCHALRTCDAGQHDPTLERIAAEWTRRQNAAARVRYVATGQSVFPKGIMTAELRTFGFLREAAGPFPPTDHVSDTMRIYMLDFERNWAMKEETYESLQPDTLRFQVCVEQTLFDGATYQTFYPPERNRIRKYHPAVIQRPKSFGRLFFQPSDYAPFLAHAIIERPGELVNPEKHLRIPVDTTQLSVVGITERDGRDLVVLRTAASERDRFSELWVDMQNGAAVRKYINYSSGKPKVIMELSYGEGGQLAGWTYLEYNDDSQLYRSETFAVTEVAMNVRFNRATFHVQPETGMIVDDQPASKRYLVTEDGNVALNVIIARDRFAPRRGSMLWLLIGGASIVTLIATSYVYAAKRRASSHERR